MFCFCDKQTLCIYMSCIYSFFCKLTMIIAWIVGTEIRKTLQASANDLFGRLGCRNSATESIAIPHALVVFLGGHNFTGVCFKTKWKWTVNSVFFSGYSALRSCAVLDYFVTTAVRMYIYIYKWCHIVAWHVLHSWTALRDTHTLLDFSPLAIFRFWSLFHALKISEIPTVLLNYT